jgi:hypothetical protein
LKKILVAAISISCSLFSTVVLAELNYDAVSLGYGTISQSGYPDITAYLFGMTKSISEYVYAGAKYERDDQPLGTTLTLDLGIHVPIEDNTDFIFTGSLMNGVSESAGASTSSNGYQLSAGIRTKLAPQLEAGFGVGSSSVSMSLMGTTSKESSIGLNVEIGYRITPQFELFAATDSSTHKPDIGTTYSTNLVAFGAKMYY